MTVRLTEAQEREACVDSFLPSPSQTTKYSWEFSRSVENNTIWVSKFDEILLDLWKPVVRYEFSYLVTITSRCKFQFSPEFGRTLLARWERRQMDIPLLVLLHLCLSVRSLHLSCPREKDEIVGLSDKRKVDGFLGQDDLPCLLCLACRLYYVIFWVLLLRATLLLVPQVQLVFIRIYGVMLSTDMRASHASNVL
ncbi:hypothetical protein D8674_034960 [Pyrus ussuriensis x Pyrus communis]|uniref:Uncharacterized protein n=1 Tax=Pyrus ussuriensis x Pyrus communis TaxID=2448454 RepID=A0A5N5GPH2_9ROSA|nr:hypothetical protein D8674_034960 [Pyrus ussuriensis x Pyrus communis]